MHIAALVTIQQVLEFGQEFDKSPPGTPANDYAINSFAVGYALGLVGVRLQAAGLAKQEALAPSLNWLEDELTGRGFKLSVSRYYDDQGAAFAFGSLLGSQEMVNCEDENSFWHENDRAGAGSRSFIKRGSGSRVGSIQAYASQHEPSRLRPVRRAQRIRIKLGGSGNLADPFPEKPRRMHWRTYHRLRAEGRAWLVAQLSEISFSILSVLSSASNIRHLSASRGASSVPPLPQADGAEALHADGLVWQSTCMTFRPSG